MTPKPQYWYFFILIKVVLISSLRYSEIGWISNYRTLFWVNLRYFGWLRPLFKMSSLPCGTLSLDKFHSGDDRVLGNLAVAPVALWLNSHILGLVQIVRRPNARWKVRQFVLLDGVWDIKRLPVVVLFIFFLLLLDLPFKWQILVDLRLGSLLLVKPWNNFDVLLGLDIVLVLTSVCRWICCFLSVCHFKATSVGRVSFCKRHLIWLRDWPILNTASLRRLHYERLLSFL